MYSTFSLQDFCSGVDKDLRLHWWDWLSPQEATLSLNLLCGSHINPSWVSSMDLSTLVKYQLHHQAFEYWYMRKPGTWAPHGTHHGWYIGLGSALQSYQCMLHHLDMDHQCQTNMQHHHLVPYQSYHARNYIFTGIYSYHQSIIESHSKFTIGTTDWQPQQCCLHTHDAWCMIGDLNDFYLDTPMPATDYAYICIPIVTIPEDTMLLF